MTTNIRNVARAVGFMLFIAALILGAQLGADLLFGVAP